MKDLQSIIEEGNEQRKRDSERHTKELMDLRREVRVLRAERDQRQSPAVEVRAQELAEPDVVLISLRGLHSTQDRMERKINAIMKSVIVDRELLPTFPIRTLEEMDGVIEEMKKGSLHLQLVSIID